MAKRVLLVDDDDKLVEVMKMTLQDVGYETISAFDGKEGMERAIMEKPDLMVLDAMMGNDTGGFDLPRELAKDKRTKNIPVIMLSGMRRGKSLPLEFERDEAGLAVREILERPIEPASLVAAAKRALNH